MVICHCQQGKVIHASTSVKWTKKENDLVTPEPQPAPNRQGRELGPGQLGGGRSLLKPRGPRFKSHREGGLLTSTPHPLPPAQPSERGAANAPDLRVPEALQRPEAWTQCDKISPGCPCLPPCSGTRGRWMGFIRAGLFHYKLQSGGKKVRESRDILRSDSGQSWTSGEMRREGIWGWKRGE